MENDNEQIKVGDFVEADWIGNEFMCHEMLKVKYKGIVTAVLRPDLVNVRIGFGSHLCTNPRKISVEDLSTQTLICIRDYLEKEQQKG